MFSAKNVYFSVCENQGRHIQIFIEARQVIYNIVLWVWQRGVDGNSGDLESLDPAAASPLQSTVG